MLYSSYNYINKTKLLLCTINKQLLLRHSIINNIVNTQYIYTRYNLSSIANTNTVQNNTNHEQHQHQHQHQEPTTKQVCDPYEQNGQSLTINIINNILTTLIYQWKVIDNNKKLTYTYNFKHIHYTVDIKYIIQYINTLHNIIINTNHHPYEYTINSIKSTITIILYTNKLHGLSYNDFQLAMSCDALYQNIRNKQINNIKQ